MVSSLSGFTQAAIEAACRRLEEEEIGQFTVRWPATQTLTSLCRAEMQANPESTEWTLERYRDAWYYAKWIEEQILFNNLTREEATMKLDAPTRVMVTAWLNQREAGTIQIPARWCEQCQGDGFVPEFEGDICTAQKKCSCRARAAGQ